VTPLGNIVKTRKRIRNAWGKKSGGRRGWKPRSTTSRIKAYPPDVPEVENNEEAAVQDRREKEKGFFERLVGKDVAGRK